jgi:hypothetical protein
MVSLFDRRFNNDHVSRVCYLLLHCSHVLITVTLFPCVIFPYHDTAARESVKAFRSKSTARKLPSANQQAASQLRSSSNPVVGSLPMQQQQATDRPPIILKQRGRPRKVPIIDDPVNAIQALQPPIDPMIGANIMASNAALSSSSIIASPAATAQQRKGGVKELDWLWTNGDLPKVSPIFPSTASLLASVCP